VLEGGNVVAKKGARILWALDGKYLIVTGFSRQSERQIMIFQTKDLKCIHTETMDVSPAILIPFYDEDSSTLFLSGKGDTTVYGFEIAEDAPFMHLLSPFKCPNPTQGLGFIIHKNALNVREVEFARAYRLTTTTIEPTSFTVPRVKSTFFQDDLFPPTRALWTQATTGSKWSKGDNKQPDFVNLKPNDMPSLSSGVVGGDSKPTTNNKGYSTTVSRDDNAKEVQNDLQNSLSKILGGPNDILEHNRMEGVDEKDWENEN